MFFAIFCRDFRLSLLKTRSILALVTVCNYCLNSTVYGPDICILTMLTSVTESLGHAKVTLKARRGRLVNGDVGEVVFCCTTFPAVTLNNASDLQAIGPLLGYSWNCFVQGSGSFSRIRHGIADRLGISSYWLVLAFVSDYQTF